MEKGPKTYSMRYRSFVKKLSNIKRMMPKEKYLFPLMDGVPFKDLEVAIILCEMAYDEATNDNQNNPNS